MNIRYHLPFFDPFTHFLPVPFPNNGKINNKIAKRNPKEKSSIYNYDLKDYYCQHIVKHLTKIVFVEKRCKNTKKKVFDRPSFF